MQKRRNILIALACLAAVVGAVASFNRGQGPHYQGRSLSDWLMIHYESDRPNRDPAQRPVAAAAICAIGTNALPQLLEWIRYEAPSWHPYVTRVLPRPVALRIGNSRLARATIYRGFHRVQAAQMGFSLLGTNAVFAIPQLRSMLQDESHPQTAICALGVLSPLGAPAFEAQRAALADTNHPFRELIAGVMAITAPRHVGTNTCLATLRALVDDPDPTVRASASNMVNLLTGKQPAGPRRL